MRRPVKLLLVVACLIIASLANAADQKVPVRVVLSIQNSDNVGQRLGFALREQIRKSSGYRLDETGKVAWGISINSISIDSGSATAYSVIITLQLPNKAELLVDSAVGTCGSSRTSECAENVLANLDQAVTSALQAGETSSQ